MSGCSVQIQEWGEKAVAGTHWTGQICFDFMAGGNGDATLYCIECNPRTR